MKRILRLTAAICAALLLCGSAAPESGGEAYPFAQDATAESAVTEFLRENGLEDEDIRVGYYNTVTGEEYYLRGDEYLYPASIFKLALCMHYARQVADGTLDWEDQVGWMELEQLVEGALVRSDNDCAGTLILGISPLMEEYRRTLAPFYGLDPMDAPEEYVTDGENTPRQIIFNLRLLYDYPERFPMVTEYLLRADPKDHFLYYAQPWPVAHKYGVMDNWGMIVNDCAIVYTRSPFLLVVFTNNVTGPSDKLSRLCARLGEYTEFDTDRRAAQREPSPSPSPTPAPTLAPTPTPTAAAEPDAPAAPRHTGAVIALGLGGGAAALLFYFLIVRRQDP